MEADWEIEIGDGVPVIEARWEGFVDLRSFPNEIEAITEAAALPCLARALLRLNSQRSRFWTAKCDVWPIGMHDLDPDELDASPDLTTHGLGCYIDLLPIGDQPWPLPASAVFYCKMVCSLLHSVTLRSCRVDLIIRRALLAPDLEGLGVTAYLSACGSDSEGAAATLEAALGAFVAVVADNSTLE